jgi:flagellar basal-body rod modification protein FlgD
MSIVSALTLPVEAPRSRVGATLNDLTANPSRRVSPLASASPQASTAAGASSATGTGDPLANESTFLTLLVSQLQNQDPLNPVDSTQFVSQLTAYSQLEQLIDINKNTTAASTAATPAASPTSGTTGA